MLKETYTLPASTMINEDQHVKFLQSIEEATGRKIESIKQRGLKVTVKFEK